MIIKFLFRWTFNICVVWLVSQDWRVLDPSENRHSCYSIPSIRSLVPWWFPSPPFPASFCTVQWCVDHKFSRCKHSGTGSATWHSCSLELFGVCTKYTWSFPFRMDLACLLGRQDLVSHFWWLLWRVLAPVSSNFWMTGSTGSGHNLKFDFWEFSEDFSVELF